MPGWPLIRPLTARERLQVLTDWPALDPYGVQAVGIQAVAAFDLATRVILDEVWAGTRKGGQIITHSDGRREVVTGRGRPSWYGHR